MATLNLRDQLNDKASEYTGKDDILGMTLLTMPAYISSSRNLMFTSHLRQCVTLTNPDVPRVFTNYENTVGRNSTAYYEAEHDYEVVDIIPRFGDDNPTHKYTMFVYDAKHDTYHIIDKPVVEDLTEKFGYGFNTDALDSKRVGDTIDKGDVLYRSTSYDEDMNYRFGKNARVMYTIDTRTIEDAIVCSKSFAKSMVSKQVETVRVTLNDNDILCNIYGDKSRYQCFPEIGQYVRDGIVCAKRRIHNNQVLYDMKRSSLQKINPITDVMYYNSGQLVDIIVYSNKSLDELDDNIFNAQIRRYLEMQTVYYQRIVDRCEEIIRSGSKYSGDIGFLYKRAKDILDDKCAWREENSSAFSHLIIDFQFARDCSLAIGSKITGRYGNKGVIADIVDDDEMPFLEDGTRVDCILNALGVINRTNPGQIFETSITFICDQVSKKIKTLPTLKEKEKLLFDIVGRFNPDECDRLKLYYKSLTTSEKKEFFDDVVTDGIYIHKLPMWEHEPIFNIIRQIYADYDWIKPVDVYINKFGRKIKILKPMVIGTMYMLKLKQDSKKNFSARSTGALSKRGIPEKSYKSKTFQDPYSTTPIRMGGDESNNMTIGVDPKIIADLHLYYRSSVTGRKDLGIALASSTEKIKDFSELPAVSNRNAEIFDAYAKALGFRVKFLGDSYNIDIDCGDYRQYTFDDGGMFIGTLTEYKDANLLENIKTEYETEGCFVGSTEEYDAFIQAAFSTAKRKRDNYYIDIPE